MGYKSVNISIRTGELQGNRAILQPMSERLYRLINKCLQAMPLLALGLIACNNTNVVYDIPEPLVDETVYVSDPSSFNLTVVGGQLLLPNAGHAGVLVYRRYFDGQFYDFAAYEAACPEHCSRRLAC